jgi:putative ABC transport system ATP-binding protein
MSARPTATSAPTLALTGVVCGYAGGGFRLEVGDLALAPGEAVALVGPSGCGKTTLLLTAAGVLEPLEGRVELEGRLLAAPGGPGAATRRARRLARLGLVFQELELLEHLSVSDNVLLAWHLGAAPTPWPEALERARRLAEGLGIARHLSRRPRVLSQGERQRAAVCRALAPQPPLLLADEPTGNLDAASATAVVDALLHPVKEHGAALLLVTHDPAVWRRMDRVLEIGRPAGARA